MGPKLGEGSFGGVYEISRILPDGKEERCALKKLTLPRDPEEMEVLRAQGFSVAGIKGYFKRQMEELVQEYMFMQELKGCPTVVDCQDIRYIQHDDGIGWDIYIRMELLKPLKKTISKGYSEYQTLRLGMDICRALVACESMNIIHRDIKPENILVSDRGVFKLGDFGIAKSSEKTQTGTVAGTFGYMAPEVANREHYGSGADTYSLGMVLYWLCNQNTLPFLPLPPKIPTAAQRQQALTRRFSGEALPPPKNGSRELKAIIQKACAFSPADRYRSVGEFGDALRGLYDRKQQGRAQIMEEFGLSDVLIGEEDIPKLRQETDAAIARETPPAGEKRKLPFGRVCLMLALVAGLGFGGAALLKPKLSQKVPETTVFSTETAPIQTARIPETTRETETIPRTQPTEETEPEWEANVICTYTEVEGGVAITGYEGQLPGEAILPETIEGLPVVSIGAGAFSSSENLKKIQLPDSITEIGEKAFSGCTGLSTLLLQEGITKIDNYAFFHCQRLTEVTIPDGVKTIGIGAFSECSQLARVTLPGTLRTLSAQAFADTALKELTVNPNCSLGDGAVPLGCVLHSGS